MAIDVPEARDRAVAAVRDLYGSEHERNDHISADRVAHAAVTFAVDLAEVTHREIASLAGVPGLLVARLIDTPDAYVDALRRERHAADRYAKDVLDEIETAARRFVDPTGNREARGIQSQGGFSKAAGVDRMTVRGWLGR